jgi:hypothetical protein
MNWKLRSKLYHLMTPEPGDNLNKEIIVEEWDDELIIIKAKKYWEKQTKELYYPAKSYAIAVTYAFLLQQNFGGWVLDYLKDPELLGGNDPYFKPFSEENYKIYNEIIPTYFMALKSTDRQSENFKKTLDYFYKEFLLAEDTKQWLPINER